MYEYDSTYYESTILFNPSKENTISDSFTQCILPRYAFTVNTLIFRKIVKITMSNRKCDLFYGPQKNVDQPHQIAPVYTHCHELIRFDSTCPIYHVTCLIQRNELWYYFVVWNIKRVTNTRFLDILFSASVICMKGISPLFKKLSFSRI